MDIWTARQKGEPGFLQRSACVPTLRLLAVLEQPPVVHALQARRARTGAAHRTVDDRDGDEQQLDRRRGVAADRISVVMNSADARLFDPSRHEALMQQDAPQYAGQGPTVVQLLQKGYALGERTLRPAQVAVSRSS